MAADGQPGAWRADGWDERSAERRVQGGGARDRGAPLGKPWGWQDTGTGLPVLNETIMEEGTGERGAAVGGRGAGAELSGPAHDARAENVA